MGSKSDYDNIFGGDLELKEDHKLDEPKMYRVILHNDHYSTMDFVIEVLMKIFHMDPSKATEIMLNVHNKGKGLCGIYSYDIAVTKINQVHQMAKERDYPLKSSCEEV
jgi:ATP-dependent Clp protease adaptor protein ClpS